MAGKEIPSKDLGLEAMSYGSVYVAQVAFGAKDAQTVKAFVEADSYDGPSLIIAYSHCIAHGFNLAHGCDHQKMAVNSGFWPLYRFDPRRIKEGKPPLILDSPKPKSAVTDFMMQETRFRMVERMDAERFDRLQATAARITAQRYAVYEQLAGIRIPIGEPEKTEESEMASVSTTVKK